MSYEIPTHPNCRCIYRPGFPILEVEKPIKWEKLPNLKKKNVFLITKWQKNKPIFVNRRVRRPTIYDYRRIKISIFHDNISGIIYAFSDLKNNKL